MRLRGREWPSELVGGRIKTNNTLPNIEENACQLPPQGSTPIKPFNPDEQMVETPFMMELLRQTIAFCLPSIVLEPGLLETAAPVNHWKT